MEEKCPTYAQVKKPLTSKKHKQKNNTKVQPIYSEVEEYSLCTNQTNIQTESAEEKEPSVPLAWCLTVLILAGSCFILLLTTGFLGFKVLQCDPKPNLKNATQEDESPVQSLPGTSEQTSTEKDKRAHKVNWSCCGESCYYFSREMKNFEDSRKRCKEMDSTLLKIEDTQELNFIQSQISYFSWIGLSREGTSSPWTWEDKSTPIIQSAWRESESENCGRITPTKMTALNCSRLITYICERKNVCLAAT
ncbi:PREDICTED: C-type lectin domain family 7 member A-like [Chinchilla lanigera]|uniref:C-type lectin domain family 7 member A-like n=1 Tax=Chinchilla lanigera TaxID=34839 RepID=UPI00038ECC8B|nr:PREDICTED: C-type lectin domain family 7 member A-like [Chinchilla lanigera]